MKKILLASVAALGLAGTASAADLAVKAPVAYVPLFTWTGCYLGANGGWISGNDDYTISHGSYGEYRPLPGRHFPSPADIGLLTHSYSVDDSGGTFGGQFGCQTQIGSWVIGGEWDWNWGGLQKDNYFSFGETPWVDSDWQWNRREEWTRNQIDWFTTARARVGFAWDRILVYATGGLAYAGFSSNTEVHFIRRNFERNKFYGSYDENRFGWTVGGGLEWAFGNAWTAKAEFLYLDFGSFDYDSVTGDTERYWRTEIDAKEYVARIGINYLFQTGGAPVVARY